MSGQVLAMTTVGSFDVGEKLARSLVENRLAACVNVIGPVRSVYRWQGEVTVDEERVLLIKTVRERLDALRKAVREGVGYELPEFVVLDISGGDEAYLNWLSAQCNAPSE